MATRTYVEHSAYDATADAFAFQRRNAQVYLRIGLLTADDTRLVTSLLAGGYVGFFQSDVEVARTRITATFDETNGLPVDEVPDALTVGQAYAIRFTQARPGEDGSVDEDVICIPLSVLGTDGDDGWTPILAVISDGARRVQQVVDWTGGTGEKPPTGQYVGIGGFVSDIADAVDIRGERGIPGEAEDGEDGNNGWTPVFAIVFDGDRRVQQVTDWTGGTGEKPTTGQYVGATGFVDAIADATDIRGRAGQDGDDAEDGEDGEDGVRGSFWTTGDTFPPDPLENDHHLFRADVASGLDWRDTDGTTQLTAATKGDIAQYNGTHWVKQLNIDGEDGEDGRNICRREVVFDDNAAAQSVRSVVLPADYADYDAVYLVVQDDNERRANTIDINSLVDGGRYRVGGSSDISFTLSTRTFTILGTNNHAFRHVVLQGCVPGDAAPGSGSVGSGLWNSPTLRSARTVNLQGQVGPVPIVQDYKGTWMRVNDIVHFVLAFDMTGFASPIHDVFLDFAPPSGLTIENCRGFMNCPLDYFPNSVFDVRSASGEGADDTIRVQMRTDESSGYNFGGTTVQIPYCMFGQYRVLSDPSA